jgi:hypothetical protein
MPGSAESAAAAAGIDYRLLHHGPVGRVAEAAAAQGVEIRDLVKTDVTDPAPAWRAPVAGAAAVDFRG